MGLLESMLAMKHQDTRSDTRSNTIEVVFCPKARMVVAVTLAFLPQERLLDALVRALNHHQETTPEQLAEHGHPQQHEPKPNPQHLIPVKDLLNSFELLDPSHHHPTMGSAQAVEQQWVQSVENRHLFISVWGHPQGLNHVLKAGDRVELTRALRVDPKVARRERFVKQGAKAAGLFAKKRPQAKAGY